MSNYGQSLNCQELRVDEQAPVLGGKWVTLPVTFPTTATAAALVSVKNPAVVNYYLADIQTPTVPAASPTQTLTIALPDGHQWSRWYAECMPIYGAEPGSAEAFQLTQTAESGGTPAGIVIKRTALDGGNITTSDVTLLVRLIPFMSA
tara:strand:- start:187 stop:630 length:444 start_codon:yes stop_codon:yes gene_type:complete